MAEESNIREELLKQIDKESDEKARTNPRSIEKIIASDIARMKRLKWIVVISWVLVSVCFIPTAFLERAWNSFGSLTYSELLFMKRLAIIVRALLLIAIILTLSLYARSKTLTIHKIQARLANIEELLKKMSQDKQPPDKT